MKMPKSLKRNLLKRYSREQLKKHMAEQFLLPLKDSPPSEPHQIVRCMACGEPKHLEFRRDGDDNMYYICHHCNFESEAIGPAPAYLK